jgi:hypothetical protein
MRTAIGLIVLGLISGVAPTGLASIGHAALVLSGTAGALLSLLICCLVGATAARRAGPKIVPLTPRRRRLPLPTPQSAPRAI